MKKRIFSILVAVCMVFTLLPATAFATEGSVSIGTSSIVDSGSATVCEHTTHDEACGYIEAAEGADCTHECELCKPTDGEKPTKPEVTECDCTVQCTASDANNGAEAAIKADCPVCGTENANLAACKGEKSAPLTALRSTDTEYSFTFANKTGVDATALYTTSANRKDWGTTLGTVNNNASLTATVAIPTADTAIDVKLEDSSSGNSYEFSGIDISKAPLSEGTITLTIDSSSNKATTSWENDTRNGDLIRLTTTLDFTSNAPADCTATGIGHTHRKEADKCFTWASNILTLNNLNLETSAATAIKLPAGAAVNMGVAGSNSSVKSGNTTNDYVRSYAIEAVGALTVSGTGSLEVTGGNVAGIESYSYGIYANGDITFDSTGTLTATGGNATSFAGSSKQSGGVRVYDHAVLVKGGTLTANGGTVAGEGGSSGVVASKVTVEGTGTLTATGGEAGGSSGVYVDGSGHITVTGGTFEAKTTSATGTAQAVNKAPTANGATIIVGTDAGSTSAWDDTTLLTTYKYIKITASSNAAEITKGTTTTGYPTLAAAVAAVAEGDTIKLTKNVTENIAIPTGNTKSFTLDLNGKTLDGKDHRAIVHQGTGTLTIKDSDTNGKVTSATPGTIELYNGSLEITGGTVETPYDNGEAIRVTGNGTVNVSGGEVKNTGTGNAIYNNASGKITISGNCVIKGGSKAMNTSPKLGNGVTLTASEKYSGTPTVTYDANNIATYQYLKAEKTAAVQEARSINLGSDVLTAGWDNNGSKLYYGNQSNGAPYKWRTMEKTDSTVTLLHDTYVLRKMYDSSGDNKLWSESELCKYLNDTAATGFLGESFTSIEQNSMVSNYSNVEEHGWDESNTYTPSQTIVAPSVEEAQNWFSSDEARAEGMKVNVWWLRTTGRTDNPPHTNRYAAAVRDDGEIDTKGIFVDGPAVVRPVFKLERDSILFTSKAAGGKTDATHSALSAVTDVIGAEWKLTLKDSGRTFAVTETVLSAAQGANVTIHYTGATSGANEKISAMITSGSGAAETVLYYGCVADIASGAADGSAVITIPAALATGNYTLKVFSEQANGDGKTDYASEMQDIALTVTASVTDGGSTGDGGSTITVTPPAPNKPNDPTTVETKVPATVDNNGKANVSITDKAVTDAINKAAAEAKKNGNEANGITLVLNVTTGGKTAASVTVNLPKAVQKKVISQKIISTVVVIDQPDVKIGMDLATMKEINRQAKADVNIIAARGENGKLTGEVKTAIGNRPVFDLSVSYGSGKTVSSFGAGSVSVALPYTLQAGEKAGNIYAVYVDANGKTSYLTGSSYDVQSKSVLFRTNHFSTYGVGYKADAPSFTDIANHWAKADIEFAAARGLLSGTSATTFSPSNSMTRGMFVTALGRLAGIDTSSYKTEKFTDVKADAYYAPYVNWAVSKGITGRSTATTFAPDQAVTRQEMAVFMINYAKAMGYTVPKTREAVAFADNSAIRSWAAKAVKAMQMAGVIMGKDGNRFDPKGTATRAEVSAVLHRYVELVIDRTTAQGLDVNDSGKMVYYENGKLFVGTKTIERTTYHFGTDGICTKIDAVVPDTKKYTIHKIVYGDTLWNIAVKNKCTVEEIVELNGIKDPRNMPVGTELKIPQN